MVYIPANFLNIQTRGVDFSKLVHRKSTFSKLSSMVLFFQLGTNLLNEDGIYIPASFLNIQINIFQQMLKSPHLSNHLSKSTFSKVSSICIYFLGSLKPLLKNSSWSNTCSVTVSLSRVHSSHFDSCSRFAQIRLEYVVGIKRH